jgi:hypothetical protein
LEPDAEGRGELEGGTFKEVGLYEVDHRKKKEGFVGGKAFRAGTELAVDGGMKVLEGSEEVDGGSLKKRAPGEKDF